MKPTPAATPVRSVGRLGRLRLRHHEVLLEIARQGSLTAAAAALDATQPAVSQWLAEIEAAMGHPLFVRGRQIQPTPFLAPALQHARRLLADARQLQQELDVVATGSSGRVRIGSMLVASAGWLPRAVLKLQADAPTVTLHVVEDIASGLLARFERRELDVLVGRLDERLYRLDAHVEPLFPDRHCVVAAPGHPLARRRAPSWAEAAEHRWVLPPRETSLRRAIDSTFLDRGLRPPEAWIESASHTLTEELLRRSDSLAVVSRAAATRARALKTLGVVRLSLSTDVGPVGMVWDRGEPSIALTRVLGALRAAASQITAED